MKTLYLHLLGFSSLWKCRFAVESIIWRETKAGIFIDITKGWFPGLVCEKTLSKIVGQEKEEVGWRFLISGQFPGRFKFIHHTVCVCNLFIFLSRQM